MFIWRRLGRRIHEKFGIILNLIKSDWIIHCNLHIRVEDQNISLLFSTLYVKISGSYLISCFVFKVYTKTEKDSWKICSLRNSSTDCRTFVSNYDLPCQLGTCYVLNPYDWGVCQFLSAYRKLKGFWIDNYMVTTGLRNDFCIS